MFLRDGSGKEPAPTELERVAVLTSRNIGCVRLRSKKLATGYEIQENGC